MKKIFTFILSLVMVLSMSTIAFAEGETETPTTYTDVESIDLAKIYKLTNSGTVNPAETFNFKIEKVSVTDSQYTFTDMPMFDKTHYTIDFTKGEATVAGDTNKTSINLPTYNHVGIFTYKITEIDKDAEGNTVPHIAGVTYDTNPLYLKVTVIEQDGLVRVAALHYATETGSKTKGIGNEYSAGNLEISKTVTGNMGEKDRYFEVVVTLSAPEGKTVNSEITVTGGSNTSNPTSITVGTPTKFYLKDDETIIIKNIPYDVTYEVEEEDYTGDNYKEEVYTFSNSDKKIKSANETVNITNERVTNVDTGILVDNLPYIIILAGVVVGMGVFFIKKRTANNN